MSNNRWQRKQQQTREALLQAAVQLILEKGYDAVTIADIARAADYGRGTFYLYFQDKEDIVWALLRHHMQALDARILEAVQHLQSPAREWLAWRMIFADIEIQRPFFLKVEGELSRRLRQIQKDHLIATFEQQLKEQRYSLLLNIPPEIGARFIVGALLELLDYWLQHPHAGSPDEMALYLFRLVFRQEPPDEDPLDRNP